MHGCADELATLLDKLALTSTDQVIFVGDLVARGPDSPRVLRLAREVGAQAVRGNHEQLVLYAWQEKSAGRPGPRLGLAHQVVLEGLQEEDWDYLSTLPLHLDFPEHGVRVVHAGVVPGVPFEQQQAWTLLHIRSLTSGGAASNRFADVSWAESYKEEPHIVFGHNARKGLQLLPQATGIDTGCVYGGSLTALVLDAGTPPPPPEERQDACVSVPALKNYVQHGPRYESFGRGGRR